MLPFLYGQRHLNVTLQTMGRSAAENLRCKAIRLVKNASLSRVIVQPFWNILLYCVIQSAAALPYNGQIADESVVVIFEYSFI